MHDPGFCPRRTEQQMSKLKLHCPSSISFSAMVFSSALQKSSSWSNGDPNPHTSLSLPITTPRCPGKWHPLQTWPWTTYLYTNTPRTFPSLNLDSSRSLYQQALTIHQNPTCPLRSKSNEAFHHFPKGKSLPSFPLRLRSGTMPLSSLCLQGNWHSAVHIRVA